MITNPFTQDGEFGRKKLSKLNKNIKRNINNIQNLNKKIADMMRKREQLIRILKRG